MKKLFVPLAVITAAMFAYAPFAIAQSDMSCMISGALFEQWVLRELDLIAGHYPFLWYHLDGPRAVRFAERACELTQYGVTIMVGTLAAAYAEAGRFHEAVATAEKACALATAANNQRLLEKNRQLLELYRGGKPYREAAASAQLEPTPAKP